MRDDCLLLCCVIQSKNVIRSNNLTDFTIVISHTPDEEWRNFQRPSSERRRHHEHDALGCFEDSTKRPNIKIAKRISPRE